MMGDRPPAVTLTREELHALVWRTPLTSLAIGYGISANGLAKICDRHEIPYPQRGYWAKRKAGKHVALPGKLRQPGPSVPTTVVIRPTAASVEPPDLSPVDKAQVDGARVIAASTTVSERLVRPHPIIISLRGVREQQIKEARQWPRRSSGSTAFTTLERRTHRILDALFKVLENCNGQVGQANRGDFFVDLNGERIKFCLDDLKSRRPLADHETPPPTSNGKIWNTQMQPTGRLVFRITTYTLPGIKVRWPETYGRRLEYQIPDIVATLVSIGLLKADARRRRDELDRANRLREREQRDEQERREQEQSQWRSFVALAHQRQDSALAGQMIAELKAAGFDPDATVAGRPLGEWVAWAESRVQALDPVARGARAVFETIARPKKSEQ